MLYVLLNNSGDKIKSKNIVHDKSTDPRKDHRTTWVIQLMSEPKFSPRLSEISLMTVARVTLSKTRNMFGLYMLHN